MKRLFLILVLACASAGAYAYGQAQLQNCSYGYNADYGKGGYTGVYKHPSGNIYTYFFPSDEYSWCPQTIDF